MTLDPSLLVRYASLKKEERDALFEATQRHPGVASVDEGRLGEILAQVADDRVAFAERRAALAAGLLEGLPGDEEMARRDALTASYDACHHALRALHIAFEGWDPIGHQETLDAATALFEREEALRDRFNWMSLGRPVQDVVSDLRTERQAAEWDIYNRDEEGNARVDYTMSSNAAVRLAQGTARTVRMALGDHRTGSL